jgi:hypothetical protein
MSTGAQLSLFAYPPHPPPASSSPAELSQSTRTARKLAGWQEVSEVGLEVGWPAAYADKELLDTLGGPDSAWLWEVLCTARYYLVDLRETSARFTLNLGGKDYRLVAVHLLPAGVMVRLDSWQQP